MTAITMLFGAISLIALFGVQSGESIIFDSLTINSPEWAQYKGLHNKTYDTRSAEIYAVSYYNYNGKLVAKHNVYADRGQRTYRLRLNQFSDMRLATFNAHFPTTTQPIDDTLASTPPNAASPPASFNILTDLGITANVQDQGTVCNSGWAYSAAKAIEIMQAAQSGSPYPDSLSAQNLIDCAGAGVGCVSQTPYSAFLYLVGYNQPLYTVNVYQNRKTDAQQGMCLPPVGATGTKVSQYARIPNLDDAAIMKYLFAGYPIIVEFDPTSIEFMHYASGIFQPTRTSGGSHFLVVIGYGTDAVTGLDYWLLQNSFGRGWGENGTIRIIRNTANPLAKSALFPLQLEP